MFQTLRIPLLNGLEAMDKHRPSEVFAVDNNYGVQLTDGQRLQICPSLGTTSNGDMANSDNSVSIMRAR